MEEIKICHITTLPMERMGIITVIIHDRCIGRHTSCRLWNKPPEADIYILHCFKAYYREFINFQKPPGSKVISLVHSSDPCAPAKCSDAVVTISKASHDHLRNRHGIKSVVIYGGIDVDKYNAVKPQYEKPAFGKISRAEPGKFHDRWNQIVLMTLNQYKDSVYWLMCNKYRQLPHINGCQQTHYIDTVHIGDEQGKRDWLQNYNIYADAHNTKFPFVETFNISMLESMAVGHACLILKMHQPAMAEILGDAGIMVDTIEDFVRQLHGLIESQDMREEWGARAKERSKLFSSDKMVSEWNEVLTSCLQ